jgi:hypothetical protein
VCSASDHLSRRGQALWAALRQAIQHAVKGNGCALSLAGTYRATELAHDQAFFSLAADCAAGDEGHRGEQG